MNFSVVIPTGDRFLYLKEAIESVNRQVLLPKEIVIVDNGVTSVNVSDLAPLTSIKINYFRGLPRFGVSQARNFGALQATHEYIAFLDDDDLWDSNYLSVVAQCFGRNPGVEIVVGQLIHFDTLLPIRKKSECFARRRELIDQVIKFNPGITGSTTVISRRLFFSKSGYDPYLITGQDKALVLDYLLDGHDCVRAVGAKVRFRLNTIGSRQTEYKKRLFGKFRFVVKYYEVMTLSQMAYNLFYIFKIVFTRKDMF